MRHRAEPGGRDPGARPPAPRRLRHVLLVDYRYDPGDETERSFIRQPVPAPLLDAHPELDLPNARAAAELPPISSDEYFDQLVDDALALIEHKLNPRRP
ncbi:hypothetical protein ABZ348_19335 [Streptomyces sp. NPDC005963]|uniref:hypothetical protein n=1 Tax=Streptomyces sp. NPDC005963 TaxID=3156721 RepID=UPI00340AAE63